MVVNGHTVVRSFYDLQQTSQYKKIWARLIQNKDIFHRFTSDYGWITLCGEEYLVATSYSKLRYTGFHVYLSSSFVDNHIIFDKDFNRVSMDTFNKYLDLYELDIAIADKVQNDLRDELNKVEKNLLEHILDNRELVMDVVYEVLDNSESDDDLYGDDECHKSVRISDLLITNPEFHSNIRTLSQRYPFLLSTLLKRIFSNIKTFKALCDDNSSSKNVCFIGDDKAIIIDENTFEVSMARLFIPEHNIYISRSNHQALYYQEDKDSTAVPVKIIGMYGTLHKDRMWIEAQEDLSDNYTFFKNNPYSVIGYGSALVHNDYISEKQNKR